MSHAEISLFFPLKSPSFIDENNKGHTTIYSLMKSVEHLLSELVDSEKISYPMWFLDINNNFKKVSFHTKSGTDCELILSKLNELGLEDLKESAIRIVACTITHEDSAVEKPKLEELSPNSTNAAWERFVQSLEPFVADIFESIRRQAVFTWDFLILLIVAALTSLLGLIENSTVILVASMLISPMMGPVMAVLFGTLTSTKKLQNLGLRNGLLAVLVCIVTGFIFGCILLVVQIEWPIGDIPTEEMTSRGELRSLWVGTLTAFLAGVAIATAILNDRWHDSIVGVAISVALLPPAVNAGLLWSMAVINTLYQSLDDFPANYTSVWSQNPSVEYASLGGISLCLTFINVIYIFAGGYIVLKVKNFCPNKNAKLWKNRLGNPEQRLSSKYSANERTALLDKRNTTNSLLDVPLNVGRSSFSHCLPHTSENTYRNLHTWTPGSYHWTFEGKPSAIDMAVRLAQQRVFGSYRTLRFQQEMNNMSVVSETSSEQPTRFSVTQTDELCNANV